MNKILIFGLPGAGKTYLAERLQKEIDTAWYNADEVRKMADDWDFSDEGRSRQANRMKTFADFEKSNGRNVICDFVCPFESAREHFEADITIWLNTSEEGRFEDTNKVFQNPDTDNVDFVITKDTWWEENHVNTLIDKIKTKLQE